MQTETCPHVAKFSSSAIGTISHGLPPQLGWHLLSEFYNCRQLPDSVETIRAQMVRAAELIGATVVDAVFHEFNPFGLSGVVVIAESHLAVHTWPEHGCACVDLFTCSMRLDPQPGMEFLRDVFQAGDFKMIEVPRGGRVVGSWYAADEALAWRGGRARRSISEKRIYPRDRPE